MNRAVPIITSVAFAFAAACSPQTEGGSEATEAVEAEETAEASEPAPCPVLDSRNWHAWVDVMPGEDAGATLHVTGEIDLPTAGYDVSLTEGAADRSAVPTQRLILTATPFEGMVAQVVTTTAVRYDGPAIARQYRSVIVMCGGAPLAEMPDVTIAE